MWKSKYETKTYTVEEKFSNISVHSVTSDVEIVLTDDGSCRVECDETTRLGYYVHVNDDTLMVEVSDTRKWYDHISILGDLGEKKLTVYVPMAEYGSVCVDNNTGDVRLSSGMVANSFDVKANTGDVKCVSVKALQSLFVSTNTGDINIDNADATDVEISTTTGKINVYKMWCNNLDVDLSTGDVWLDEVVALGYFDIECTTGSVTIESSDASSINIKTNTGNVYASFITGKIVFADTTTGEIDIPHSTSGAPCNIKTTTGDITVEIKPLKEDK